MIKSKTRVTLELCNEHLKKLFQAIERADIKGIYEIEHKLTYDEECVACAYALRAKGAVGEVLDTLLNQEGFMIAPPHKMSLSKELAFWLVRIVRFTLIFIVMMAVGTYIKTFLFESKTWVTLGSFGISGVMLLTLAIFILMEQWLVE